MKRTHLNMILTKHALANVPDNSTVIDAAVEGRVEHNLKLKNVCAKVSEELSDSIDQVVASLRISKRLFLEAAFIEAVRQAQEVLVAEGVWLEMESEEGK